MEPMDRLILIDGSAVAYRSYFAFIRNPLINSRGENTGAIFGFVNSITKIINDFKPQYFGVVFDTPVPTFRHEYYPEYKSTRAKTPFELIEQFPWIDQAILGFNIPVIKMDGYEADDVIGTLAQQAAGQGLEVLMFTGDKDYYQLVNDKIKILHPKDFSIIDSAGVKEKFGVPPEKVIDTLALMGDTADNIPGVAGVGPKTAISLIEEFGDLDNVLEKGPTEKKGKLAESLSKYKDQAILSRRLATIKLDCPIQLELDKLIIEEPDYKTLAELFRRLEFKNLADKYASTKAESLFQNETKSAASDYRTIDKIEELDSVLDRDCRKRGIRIRY